MSYQLIFENKALKEFSDSFDWYEDQQAGLGNKFEKAVYQRLSEIQQNPERYPRKIKHYHETKIKKFSFLIVYRIYEQKKIILVVSVFHASRNPKWKFIALI